MFPSEPGSNKVTVSPFTESIAIQCSLWPVAVIWITMNFWYFPSAAVDNSFDKVLAKVLVSVMLTLTLLPIRQLSAISRYPVHVYKFPEKPPFSFDEVTNAPGLNDVYPLGKFVIWVPERAIWMAIEVARQPTCFMVLLPIRVSAHCSSYCFHVLKSPEVVVAMQEDSPASPLNS